MYEAVAGSSGSVNDVDGIKVGEKNQTITGTQTSRRLYRLDVSAMEVVIFAVELKKRRELRHIGAPRR